jgi:2,4-dienoyl-CoA reductase-like NADH-dependent reductase (Old Yellow Enzyme family)
MSTSGGNLFKPFQLAGHTLQSRVFLAPINTGFARNGRPSANLVDFHRRRSGPAIGVSMVGNVSVSSSSVTNGRTVVLSEAATLSRFAVLARAITANGSLAGIQLAYCPADLRPAKNWVCRDRRAEQNRLAELVSSITLQALSQALLQYVLSVRLAWRAGFQVIQIHAAHGYLLSLLLHPLVNKRTDRFQFGGAWLPEFASQVREASYGRILSFRLSLYSGLLDSVGGEVQNSASLTADLSALGVDLVDYSTGFYTVNRKMIYPGAEDGPLPYLELLRGIARSTRCVIGCAGNVSDLRELPPIESNMVVSVGRALIADSAFVAKSKALEFDRIVHCTRAGRCHYYSRGRSSIECGVNRDLARFG